MVSIMEIMQLCRLCLVKEQVNIPIFEDQGDISQIYLKITACLPVKVSKEDELPKKICDGCLYKLELLYQFWNSTASAEKQLLSWIKESSMDVNTKSSEDLALQPQLQEHTVKQEQLEPAESTNESVELSTEAQSYILQQQQLSYQADFPFKESQGSNNDSPDVSENSDEPLSKRRKRRQATKPIPPESLDSSDNEAADSLLEMTVTKTEEESESDVEENIDGSEPVKFVAVGGEDTEQPGPSGLGKGATDAPLIREKDDSTKMALDAAFKCTDCLKVYKSSATYKKHILNHSVISCSLCSRVFKTAFNLRRHQKAVHEKNISYICDVCDKYFKTKSYLEVHRAIHFKSYKFSCHKCGSGYPSLSALKNHQNVQHCGLRFMCSHCDKVFMNEHYYKKHVLIHQPSYIKKEYVCPVCSKVLYYSKTYKNHMKIHNGRDYHICEFCGKALSTVQSLIDHKRLHTGEKPYICEACGKNFTNKKLMRVHERTHTKEKPYMCNICGKSFTQRSTLTIHVRYHTGERPYNCSFCQKKFITKTLLKTHSKIHGVSLS